MRIICQLRSDIFTPILEDSKEDSKEYIDGKEDNGEDIDPRIISIDFNTLSKQELIYFINKLIYIIESYHDDKSCKADMTIEIMRSLLYKNYVNRYDF